MTLFIISFLAGLLTVLAPCVLPLLPVIVGGSVSGGAGKHSWKRALTVTFSLALSLIVFTLLLKVSTLFINIPASVWTWISGSIIICFGFVSLFPKIWESVPLFARLNQKSNMVLGSGYQKKSFWGDVIIGASLGPVFSTCSPTYFVILATVLPVSFTLGLTYLIAYAVGLSLALLCVAFVGQKIMGTLGVASDPRGWFKRSLGVLFVIVGVAIIGGYDKKFQLFVLNSGVFDVTTIEQKLLQKNAEENTPQKTQTDPSLGVDQTAAQAGDTTSGANGTETPKIVSVGATSTKGTPKNEPSFMSLAMKKIKYKQSAEITNVDGYINTGGAPITISQFKGKSVVLVDFWTYSCINCQRTLPYVTAWYGKYKDQGLVIIGVHTPEFAFEHVQKNVEDATGRFNIKYPVVLDNNYATWNAFGNQFWPRKYLVDIDGYIVYDHIGEGEYDKTEHAIQDALKERNARLATNMDVSTDVTKPVNVVTMGEVASPETYFGANRNEYLGNGQAGKDGEQNLTLPQTFERNKLYLVGQWNIGSEFAETSATVGAGAVGSDRVDYRYKAKNVYFVAGAKDKPVTMEVLRDGKPLDASFKGADVFIKDGKSYVTITGNRLYKIIEDSTAGEHLLKFIISSPGLQAYTFTFG